MIRIVLAFSVLTGLSQFAFGQNTFPPTGNVGIGTNSPTANLDVRGIGLFQNGSILDIALTTPAGKNGIVFSKSEYGNYSRFNLMNVDHASPGSRYFQLRFNQDSEGLTIQNGGNIGIGTSSPTNKLQIANAFSFHDGGHEVIGFGWAHGGSGVDLDPLGYSVRGSAGSCIGDAKAWCFSVCYHRPNH
ncbi:MAG: hypothetical protein KI790_11460 [Cyclobacteriaceae bacterium]|nr:hypothetical protein [Cyclobacteriaceae bacterium HetDA_MAG_MS6]